MVQKKSPRSKRSIFGGTTSGGRSGQASKLTTLKQGPSSGTLFDINQGHAAGSTTGKIGGKKAIFAGLTKSPESSQPQILLEEENFRLGPLQMLGPLADRDPESPAPRTTVKFSTRGENEDLGPVQDIELGRSSVQVGKGAKRLDMPSSLMNSKPRRSRAHSNIFSM